MSRLFMAGTPYSVIQDYKHPNMIIIPTTLGQLTIGTQYAVKFVYLERGVSYIIVAGGADANNVSVTFYDSTYTLVQKTDYLPVTQTVWQVDTTQ